MKKGDLTSFLFKEDGYGFVTIITDQCPNSLKYDVRWKGGFSAGKLTFRPTVAFWDVLEHMETKISGKGGFPEWWFCAHAQVRVRYTA